MEAQDIEPVLDYELVIMGPDAADIVWDVLTKIEIEVNLADDTDRCTNASWSRPAIFP
ncbi:hypothetical protein HYG81_21575 (plasmid) [Natrinema zhouii]|uniref:hypothetical protein n=1 Tax=Natrinema zhouii TaxID=1710539 RepID=UPI001CFFDCAB|nr:hypothetical protein [Natrinema zhouii]UHQ98163.1 hypothetical protein HYG81_21575 [Natrinema zhouii]